MDSRPKFSALELAQEILEFEDWSVAVGMPPKVRSGAPLPDELKEILKLSRTFPTWFRGGVDSLPYSSLDPLLLQFTTTFRDLSNPKYYFADNETNKTLKEALPTILRSCWRMTQYSVFETIGEADWRSVVDVIILDAIWPLLAEHRESILVTMEPELGLPKTRGSVARCVSATPGTAFCIDAGRALLRKHLPSVQRDFHSFFRPSGIKSLLIPHLLIEYKSPTTAAETAFRQVQIAMVSALYQRRALQRPEHFVFGICHTSATFVHVIAARWTLKATVQDTEMTGDRTHASTSEETPEASRQSNAAWKIEFYTLGELNLRLPIDLVRLYLLVLATVPLAMTYRDQLLQNPPAAPASDFDDWADDRTRTSKSETTRTFEGSEDGESGEEPGSGEEPESREEPESSPDPLHGRTDKSGRLSPLGDSPTKYGVPGRNLKDIQLLPEMSSRYKCLRYVESLPSSVDDCS